MTDPDNPTVIISDAWPSYNHINELGKSWNIDSNIFTYIIFIKLGFDHVVYNHSEGRFEEIAYIE